MFIKIQPILYIILGLFFFILDRIIKYLFYNQIINNSFLFTYTQNSGIAFGLPLPEAFSIPFILLILVIFIIWLIRSFKQQKHLVIFSLWLIILGAASNIIDRIKFNFVVDYIDLHFWPIFNLADTLIVVGAIILIYHYSKEESAKI